MRVMVSAALLYTFTVKIISFRYIMYSLVFPPFLRKMLKNKDFMIWEEDYLCMEWLVFFLIMLGLLSINFLQYGIYLAILAWILLLIVLIINSIGLMREV